MPGHFLLSHINCGYSCLNLISNCEVCTNSLNNNVCFNCSSQYTLDNVNNICIPCFVSNCLTCRADNICSTCNAGLVPSVNGSSCVSCNLTSCVDCSADNFCANCLPNFLSVNGICELCGVPSCLTCNNNTSNRHHHHHPRAAGPWNYKKY